jgi:hypothetical protein
MKSFIPSILRPFSVSLLLITMEWQPLTSRAILSGPVFYELSSGNKSEGEVGLIQLNRAIS